MLSVEVFTILYVAFSAAVVVAAVAECIMLKRGDNRRRMFEPSYRAICDGIDGAGISVICLDATADTIASLLASEYERFEVIVLLDSMRDPDLAAALTERYSLVCVDHIPTGEPVSPTVVRRLCRSRRRRFRRLTVMDIIPHSEGCDADAAVDIAVGDYVALLKGGACLLPGATERIAAEIAAARVRPREVGSRIGIDFAAFLRDDVVSGGGFASGKRHFCRRRDRITLCEPLAVGRRFSVAGVVSLALLLSVTLAAGIALALLTGSAFAAASVTATWLATASAAIFQAPFAAPHLRGIKAFAYALQNFCKNLL